MAKILIVEDDEGTRDLLTEVVTRWGHQVVLRGNGREGLDAIATGDFTLIISDVRMPVMDGLTMLKELRKAKSDLPVIIITGYPSFDSAVASLDEGADYYLVKPINLDDLKAKISKCLAKSDMIHRLARTIRMNRILLILLPLLFTAGLIIGKLLLG